MTHIHGHTLPQAYTHIHTFTHIRTLSNIHTYSYTYCSRQGAGEGGHRVQFDAFVQHGGPGSGVWYTGGGVLSGAAITKMSFYHVYGHHYPTNTTTLATTTARTHFAAAAEAGVTLISPFVGRIFDWCDGSAHAHAHTYTYTYT